MRLPHNCYMTSKTLAECIDAALSNRALEVDLAASKHFWDYDGDPDAPEEYDDFYAETVTELAEILGDPVYESSWGSADRDEWESILPEFADAQELTVWKKNGINIYVRLSWEDKEIPILIAMGTDGCAATGISYPGQF